MTLSLWCLMIVALLPYVLAGVGGYFRRTNLGTVDNDNPRGQAALLEGAGARAYAAQANAWEALALFLVGLALVHFTGNADQAGTASVIFVIARILHAVFYIRGVAMLRSLSFFGALGAWIWLVVIAASG
ncbi:MAG: MAPEG family protein [Pseudomonadota bacterium]|nr:MAPEG family protein [Pseudomonadota bacterium]